MIRYLKLTFRGPANLGENLYCTITSVKVYGYSMNFMMRKSLTDLQTEHSLESSCTDLSTPCITVTQSELPRLVHQPFLEPVVEI